MNPLKLLNSAVGVAQRAWPVLAVLDDSPWKRWCWHFVWTLLLGYAIGFLPYISPAIGAVLIAGLYFNREIDQIVDGPTWISHSECIDHVMGVTGPALAISLLAAAR